MGHHGALEQLPREGIKGNASRRPEQREKMSRGTEAGRQTCHADLQASGVKEVVRRYFWHELLCSPRGNPACRGTFHRSLRLVPTALLPPLQVNKGKRDWPKTARRSGSELRVSGRNHLC